MYNVKDYGAKGDKQNNDRAAIQAAIDDCSRNGGGVVYFPPGDYLTGNIQLRSYTHIRLDAGSTLWASRNKDHYNNASCVTVGLTGWTQSIAAFLSGEGITDILISGPGSVNLQTKETFGICWGVPEKPDFRVKTLCIENSRNINIQDITFSDGDFWGLHFKCCEDIVIDRVKLFNQYYRLNSDGIDPDSCKNVTISNCHIHIGDDCIVMKASDSKPCENVTITNCILETPCTAIKIGTESVGDFRDIHVSNCVIRKTAVGMGIYIKDGATAERISFQNISVENAPLEDIKPVCPIFMDIEKRYEDSKIGKIRDVIFNGIQISGGSGILIQGMPEHPIENLTLQNISLRVDRAVDFSNRKKPVTGVRKTSDERDTCFARKPYYMCLAHIRGLTVENYRLMMEEQVWKNYDRGALYGKDLHGGVIRNIHTLSDVASRILPFYLEECQDILL